jgi:hypothetical protein
MPPPIRPPQFGQRGSPQGGIYDDADFLQDEGWPGTSTPNVGGIPEPLPGPQVPFPPDRQVAGPEMGEMSGPETGAWTEPQVDLAGPETGADYQADIGPVSPYPPGGGYGPVPEAPDVLVTEPGGGYGPAPEAPDARVTEPMPWPSRPRHPENVVEVDYVPGYGPAPEPPGPPPGPPGPGDLGFIMPGSGIAPPPRPSKPDFRAPWDPTQQVYDYMPGDPGYNPDEGRGMFSPWIPGSPHQRAGAQEGVDTWEELHAQAIQDREGRGLRPPGDSVSPLDRMMEDIRVNGSAAARERELALQHLESMDQLRPIDQTVTARPDLRQLMPLDRPDLAGWAPVGEAPPPWVPPGWSPQGRQVEEERRRTEVPPERRLLGRQRRRIGDY